jgi:predicted nucleic-acid-binding protein
MRAVDTNVLVRLITRDDKKQVESAEEFVSKGAWVSHLVLAETSWVLDSVYDRTREDIAKAVEMLLNHEHLTLQDQDGVEAAVEKLRRHRGVTFSDALALEIARKSGHIPLGTVDRNLAKLEGGKRLKSSSGATLSSTMPCADASHRERRRGSPAWTRPLERAMKQTRPSPAKSPPGSRAR